jgi:hypothetical protein
MSVWEILDIYCQYHNKVPTGGRPNANYLTVTGGGAQSYHWVLNV